MEYDLLRTAWKPKIIGVKNGIAQVLIDKNKFIVKEDYTCIADFFSGINWEQKPASPTFEIHARATLLPKKVGKIMQDLKMCDPNEAITAGFKKLREVKGKLEWFGKKVNEYNGRGSQSN